MQSKETVSVRPCLAWDLDGPGEYRVREVLRSLNLSVRPLDLAGLADLTDLTTLGTWRT